MCKAHLIVQYLYCLCLDVNHDSTVVILAGLQQDLKVLIPRGLCLCAVCGVFVAQSDRRSILYLLMAIYLLEMIGLFAKYRLNRQSWLTRYILEYIHLYGKWLTLSESILEIFLIMAIIVYQKLFKTLSGSDLNMYSHVLK